MNELVLSPALTIAEVLNRHALAATVLIRFRMACVGCPLSCFESLESAAQTYGLEPELLMAEIRTAILRERDIVD